MYTKAIYRREEKKMKKLLSMVLCAMMALTLAGCGGSGGDSSTYTFSSELDIKNLDSSDADDGCSFTAMHAVIDGLMKTDKKGNVVNGVASSSEVSDDGLTHTYKIRKDAKWANGDPVTANDFVYAWHRIFQKKGQYYYMFCDGIASIVGAQEMSDKIALKEVIDCLDHNDRQLITLRYFGNKTQVETANRLGMTQVQVSRREKKILMMLREKLTG